MLSIPSSAAPLRLVAYVVALSLSSAPSASAAEVCTPDQTPQGFSYGSASAGGTWKFVGAVAVKQYVVFVPRHSETVWVMDTATSSVQKIASGDLKGQDKYAYGAAVGTKAYFAPLNRKDIGIFDTATMTFSLAKTSGLTGDHYFYGAAALGTKVYFTPCKTKAVGIYDTSDGSFKLEKVEGSGVADVGSFTGSSYSGCHNDGVSIGNVMYFSCRPFTTDTSVQGGLLAFDTASGQFSGITGSGVTGHSPFNGLAKVGKVLYMAPEFNEYIGYYDTEAREWGKVSTSLSGFHKFSGATAIGTSVYFTPYFVDAVGVFDTISKKFRLVRTPTTGQYKYKGAAAVGAALYFAPQKASKVLIYNDPDAKPDCDPIPLVGGGGTVKSTITVKGSCAGSNQCPEYCAPYGGELDCRHPKKALNDNTIDPWKRTWLSTVDSNYKTGNARTPFDLIYTLEKAAVSIQYRLWARPGYETQAPDSWTLQGSNNLDDWKVLDKQADVGQWPRVSRPAGSYSSQYVGGVAANQKGEARIYTFKNSVAYKHYKLSITKCGNNQWTQISLSQWALYGPATPATTSTATATTTTSTGTSTTATATTRTTTTTTPTPCSAGEYLSVSSWGAGASCKPCRYGTFRGDRYPHWISECTAWQRCDVSEFEVAKGNATHNYICQSHTECAAGEFESRRPSPGYKDRECTPITLCVAGQYVLRAATTNRDQQCRNCDGSSASFADGLCTTTTRTQTTKTRTTETETTTQTTTSSTTTATSTTTVTPAFDQVFGGDDDTLIYSDDLVDRSADADADGSTAGQDGAGSDTTTLIVVVVAVVLVVAVVAGAVVYTRRVKKDAGSGSGIAAFENPMYAGGGIAESAYMDVPASGSGGGSFGAAGYMDVSAGATGNNTPAAGYMDVAPNTSGASPSAFYMDVAPNSGGGEAGFDDDGFSDNEEV